MSRTRNHLQQHVEEYLADRHDMRDWIRRAQVFSPWLTPTEYDWERYGHLSIDRWLMDKRIDEEDPYEDSWAQYWNEYWDLREEEMTEYDDSREQEMAEYFYESYDPGNPEALDNFAATL